MNNGVTTAHSDAEAARQSAVNAQEAADAWRKGSTPNAGPVLALSQGPSGKTATYDERLDGMSTVTGNAQNLYEGKRTWGINEQERENVWRGVHPVT
jgi:hypothetical protein